MRALHTKELLIELGKLLQQRRLELGMPLTGPQECGGPNYQTIERHEAGKIRTLQALDRHVRILEAWLPDLLWMVLAPVYLDTTLRTEHEMLAGHYDRTTDAGRDALMRIAATLPFRQPAHANTVQPPRHGPHRRARSTPRSGGGVIRPTR
jgi:hypothetical protein